MVALVLGLLNNASGGKAGGSATTWRREMRTSINERSNLNIAMMGRPAVR